MTPGTALVTGPTAGIGRAFAERLAARGHDLVLVARDRGRLNELADELRRRHGVEVEVLRADLADREALGRVEERVSDPARPISVLVNNAGFGHRRPFAENSVEDEQLMLDVLVGAVLRLSHAALGAMLERGEGQIVNVASVAAFLPRGTYSAAKRYVVSFTEWMDLTYRDRGVRAMALCPGFVRTEFHPRMGIDHRSAPRWMWLEADRLVDDALRDLDRGRRVSIPSKRYKVLAAVAEYTPSSLQARFQGLGRK
jgi:short-subunit dehydrogenase